MKNIIRSLIVSVLVIVFATAAIYGVVNRILTYDYEIVGGYSVLTYSDEALTNIITGGDLYQPPRWTSTWREMYVQNITDESVTITVSGNQPDTFEINLYEVIDDQMVENPNPVILLSGEVKHIFLEFYVYPEAPLGTGDLEVTFNTVVYQ